MRTYQYVYLAAQQSLVYRLTLFGSRRTCQQSYMNMAILCPLSMVPLYIIKRFQERFQGLVVLVGEDLGRSHYTGLVVVVNSQQAA